MYARNMTHNIENQLASRYDIKWIGRCTYETSDKVWGWFFYKDPTQSNSSNLKHNYCYVFYAATGKTPSFKRHQGGNWAMEKLQKQKIDRKYQKITVDELVKLWPNLYDDLNNKFIFHLLANDI